MNFTILKTFSTKASLCFLCYAHFYIFIFVHIALNLSSFKAHGTLLFYVFNQKTPKMDILFFTVFRNIFFFLFYSGKTLNIPTFLPPKSL